jgi:acetyltransferase-like isoleucine patch superfamily enzyme
VKNPRNLGMLQIFANIIRFFGIHSPLQSMRIAVYRKAGIRIGRVSGFGSNNWLDINFRNLIIIEDDVLLTRNIQILNHSFLFTNLPLTNQENEKDGFFPVIIKKGARIGINSVILPGVTIGENSVVGACSVVTKDIPPNCVAVGVPAKPVRYFNSAAGISDKCVARDGKTPLKHPMLYLKCKTCGIEGWSVIRCDKQIFRTLDLRGNFHFCSNGHKNRYDKKDYYYRT